MFNTITHYFKRWYLRLTYGGHDNTPQHIDSLWHRHWESAREAVECDGGVFNLKAVLHEIMIDLIPSLR